MRVVCIEVRPAAGRSKTPTAEQLRAGPHDGLHSGTLAYAYFTTFHTHSQRSSITISDNLPGRGMHWFSDLITNTNWYSNFKLSNILFFIV
jgi:hypothetical protein